MPQPRSLIDLLRSKTDSDDLLRTLLKAQAAHSQSAVQPINEETAIRVVALSKNDRDRN